MYTRERWSPQELSRSVKATGRRTVGGDRSGSPAGGETEPRYATEEIRKLSRRGDNVKSGQAAAKYDGEVGSPDQQIAELREAVCVEGRSNEV